MTIVQLVRRVWFVTACAVAVIAWGSVVRATGSGAGCGGHWPTCDGAMVLLPKDTAMLVELVHRASSGLLILLVAWMLIGVLRTLPAGHAAKKTAVAASVVLVIEALLGAGLVLFGLVADNDSTARAVVIAVHLTNTLMLLGFLTLTAWLVPKPSVQLEGLGMLGMPLAFGLAAYVIVGASGAVTALGDTLFPAATLREGIRQDMGTTAHFLIKMRVIHPVLASATGAYFVLLAGAIGRARPRAVRASVAVTILVIGQVALGLVNLALLAPIPVQVIHLLAADLLWIALIVMCADAWLTSRGRDEAHVDRGELVSQRRAQTERDRICPADAAGSVS